ncbi:hypothetical protein V6N11_055302 [Hibiscus sabdariffa]|uniref:Uncharacterized protein n=1 Tax=Hibiscus sabdariffa TaxID=183260 RepID=A0ABR2PFM7_9ROSI
MVFSISDECNKVLGGPHAHLENMGLVESTTDAVEDVPISFIPASSQDNVPIHADINQDNAPPSQDNAQRTKKSVLYGRRLKASLARFSDNLEDRKSEKMKSVVSIQPKDKNRVNQSSESSSGYSSAHVLSTASMNGSCCFCIEEDEVAKEICLEKASLVDVSSAKLNYERQLGERVFLGNIHSEEKPSLFLLENSNPIQASSEAVRSALNATTMKALGPSSQVDCPLVSWDDIVAKILVSPGDRVERAHEVLGFSFSASKGILEAERPILRDGNLTNFVNRELECFTLPLPELQQIPKSGRFKRETVSTFGSAHIWIVSRDALCFGPYGSCH